MDPISTARYGLMAASRTFETAAAQIAQQGVDGAQAPDPGESIVSMIQSKHAFEANLTTVKFAQQMWDSLLSLQSR